jgi:hypothetical protein
VWVLDERGRGGAHIGGVIHEEVAAGFDGDEPGAWDP